MNNYVKKANVNVAGDFVDFVENEALLDSGISPDVFWQGLSKLITDLGPANRELLRTRDRLQAQIDEYHRASPGQPDPDEYRAFLTDIGYLRTEPEPFTITTAGVDEEIALQAGPQLVVPVLNARFAVNAANARWGSLYDALYGTDALSEEGELARGDAYNERRGELVIARGRELLDVAAPLDKGSHADATHYEVVNSALVVTLNGGHASTLRNLDAFLGYQGEPESPSAILLRHHGLHLQIVVDRGGAIGQTDAAGVQDIILESAVTTIIDLEDSVTTVDAEDKILAYRNWRELMLGTLSERVTKNGVSFDRTMNPDRVYTGRNGDEVRLHGRSLLFVRNVGHLMQTDVILDSTGQPIYEGMLDAVMTALGALPDIRGHSAGTNSRTGSIYIVKPKMHGPDEVTFAVELFTRVEELLGLEPLTLKLGIMDEERRTTVNLRACIAAASERVVFINTGFLDRTGDEIRTSMFAGPMVPKSAMRSQSFMQAYELSNVDAGLRAGFPGRAQIGKGMWAMPELMNDMLEQKVAHPQSGASTAWVPSPAAATLHALHYHQVDAFARQRELSGGAPREIDPILVIPLAKEQLDDAQIKSELDNNVQSILGYVVRWIDHGVGCSKVPDIHGVALMEDRATLRISSQLMANWLAHGIITEADVDESLKRLSPIVDGQNAGDPRYEALIGESGPGLAFEAARRLIVEGAQQTNGYTEPILHEIRRRKKSL